MLQIGELFVTESEELSFRVAGDWEAELRRLNATQWKTVQVNQSHNLSLVLPEVLVVPAHLRTPEIKMAAVQFVDNRLPVSHLELLRFI